MFSSRARHAGALALLALTLSVLNPVLCIWHCLFFDYAPTRGGAMVEFVCHIPGGAQTSAPTSDQGIGERPAPPRAFYESALGSSTFAPLLFSVALLATIAGILLYRELPPPPAPPPKRCVATCLPVV